MTRREIFLKADPHMVNDLYSRLFTNSYKIEEAFDICKGLKFFARGERYDEPEEITIDKIMNSGTRFKYTPMQVHFTFTRFRGFLDTAIDALEFNKAPNIDESVNKWLDQTAPESNNDANRLAVDIISKLIKKRIERWNEMEL